MKGCEIHVYLFNKYEKKLKKIIIISTFSILMIFSLFLGIKIYQSKNQSIVPLDEVEFLHLTSNKLTTENNIKGKINLNKYESFKFLDVIFYEDSLFLMIYKEPKIFSQKNEFSYSLETFFDNNDISEDSINAIYLSYWDNTKSSGFSESDLMTTFPKKLIWEK